MPQQPPLPNPPPQRGREYSRVIIIHTTEHITTALEAARELNLPLTLQTAPDALFYAGSLYLWQLYTQAKARFPTVTANFILDCADAGAEAIGAITVGHKALRSSAPAPLRAKIADIAAQYGVRMVEGDYEALDLHRIADTKGACITWLSGAPL